MPLGDEFRHHVVPVSWQKIFAANGHKGKAFYRNVLTKKSDGPIGPKNRMKEDYANVLFDPNGLALKDLEVRLGRLETQTMPVLKTVIATNCIHPNQRILVATLLALQCLRYPEYYEKRLNRAREMAIELGAAASLSDCATLNVKLHTIFPELAGTTFTQDEYYRLFRAAPDRLESELEEIVYGHLQNSFGLNPNTVIDAIPLVATKLSDRSWDLVQTSSPDLFVLSDRPVPEEFNAEFSVALSPALALRVDPLTSGSMATPVVARAVRPGEAAQINAEAQERAREWLCASAPF
jgi:hypothetical protein